MARAWPGAPLGCGVETTWKRLVEGKCRIRALNPEDLKMNAFDRETQMLTIDQLTSKDAAIMPCGTNPVARFISYAICAAGEVLKDAKWVPAELEQKERTGVSIGGEIGSISDILDASTNDL
ncbi:3-oxoacyl-[acyl-carrier-protein] synthase, mitochondrial-like [Durio zibethinus]|uniref:beta-ketoacyl-[acyl-carrier-protein] synthase I n=1 Tax=Durio zibethinus TaxID=66656 RepID=A0A6P6A2I9_DURZI|nr:3-oxoacyl-[acyl-carrier-protein] synthase, mitochondrial-like [Durio zibethinus]